MNNRPDPTVARNSFRIRTSEKRASVRDARPERDRRGGRADRRFRPGRKGSLSSTTNNDKSFTIRTSKKVPSNSFRMRTYKNKGLKVLQNEHFRKNPVGRGSNCPSSTSTTSSIS